MGFFSRLVEGMKKTIKSFAEKISTALNADLKVCGQSNNTTLFSFLNFSYL